MLGKKSFFHCLVFLMFFFCCSKSFATQLCNSNLHCRGTWVCIGGTADNGDKEFTGRCKPNIVIKQVCMIHKIATGQFAKAVTLIAIASVSIGFFVGKVEWTHLFTIVLGIGLIFGSMQIISFLTRDSRPFCDLKRA